MVLTFITGFAATFGAAEGVRAAQNKSRREEHRTRKNNLVVHCAKGSKHSALLEGRRVVLAGKKLYVDTGTEYNVPFGHPFEGYFLPYPSQPFPGLVSTITHEAPIMNWVFVHAQTHELRFGPRAASEGNATGPWDCTRQDKRLTFSGWEGFCAVPEGDFWALYFDREGDRLKGKVAPGTPVVEVELLRVEMRVGRPVAVEMSEEEMVRERERKESVAREMADRAAAMRVQEEAERRQSECLNEQDEGKGSDKWTERPPVPAQNAAASPQQQPGKGPEQRTNEPRQQQEIQPEDINGRDFPTRDTNTNSKRRKSPPRIETSNGTETRNQNARGPGVAPARSRVRNSKTPKSRGRTSPRGCNRPDRARDGATRGAGSDGDPAGARKGNANSKGAAPENYRNGASSGSSDASRPSSGPSPPSTYPFEGELPPSPDCGERKPLA